MTSYLLFLLLGLGSGAVYATLALGLVLKHRSAGIVDFSHGAVAMFCAYVFLELHSNGQLVFPWVALPHSAQLFNATNGAPTWVSIVIALLYSAVLGLIFYWVVVRPLRHAPALARVGASVGLMLYLEAVAVINFGTFALSSPPILPATPVHLADGLDVPSDRLYLAGIVIVVGILLGLIYRYTRFGLATRAAAGNERGAALIGLSATRLSAYNWVLATVLAGAAGILILPITTLNPGTYTLFIVPALGAALLARFTSFPWTVVAGLGLGMFQSELVKLQGVWTWLPQQGLQDGVPFILIMIAIVVLARRLPARGVMGETHTSSIGRPVNPLRTAGISFAIGLVALLLFSELYRSAMASSLVVVCVCLSVVVITGYVGPDLAGPERLCGDQRVHDEPHRPVDRAGVPVRAHPGGAVRGRGRRGHRAARGAHPRRQSGGGDPGGGLGARRPGLQLVVVLGRLRRAHRRRCPTCSGSTSACRRAAARSCSGSSSW